MKGLVCLPLHVWDRELDSRLLWAYFLAKNGFDVIFGHEYSISSLYGSGIPIFHLGAGRPIHNNPRSTHWYAKILENDGYVGLVYEEGINDLGHGPDHHFAGITDDSVKACSRLFGWAPAERSLCMQAAPSESLSQSIYHKYVLSCHTRFELMSPALGGSYFTNRISSLSELFGSYFLVSDNFAVESYGLNSSMDKKAQYSQFASDDRLNQLLEMRKNESVNLASLRDNFSDALANIATALPHIHFVLRPHPVANPNYWHSKFHNYRNISTICYEACDPWIFASRGLIHSGCTMGLQAMIAKVPSIDLSTLIDDNRHGLSSSVCTARPSSITDILNLLRSSLNSPIITTRSHTLSDYELTDVPSYLASSLSVSGLSKLNSNIPESCRVPNVSMSLKVVQTCRKFFASRQNFDFHQYTSCIDKLLNDLPILPPNPGKTKTWTAHQISYKIKSFDNIFSSYLSGFEIDFSATKSPNVFVIRANRN